MKVGVNPTSNIAAQVALGDFLDSGGAHKHFRRLRRRYREQVDRFCESLTRHVRGPIRLHRPAGGHLLWVELPRSVDAMALFERALAHKISVAPGVIFSPDGRFRHHLRLNVAVPWTLQVNRAIRVLGRLIDERASKS